MTLIISDKLINDIVGDLECGFICYIDKKTSEKVSIRDRDGIYFDIDAMEEEDLLLFEKLDDNPDNYIEIEKMSSRDSYRIMEGFIAQLKNDGLKNRLTDAINRRKPFRQFRNIVDDNLDLRDEYFAFRTAKFKEYVVDIVNVSLGIFEDDEEGFDVEES